jgi:hypothetical protein
VTVRLRDRAVEQAVLARVVTQLPLPPGISVIGIRCPAGFRWDGSRRVSCAGQDVAIEVCPSVLAVLDAVVGRDRDGEVLVILTAVEERDLGDDVLARLHHHRLLEASRQTLLQDLAGGRTLDPGIINTGWLSDALVELFTTEGADGRDSSVPLTRQAAVDVLLSTCLGLDPLTLDGSTVLTQLLTTDARRRWTTVTPDVRDHLIDEVRDRWGPVVATALRMAARSEDVLVPLLLLDVVGYPTDDMVAAQGRGVLVNEVLGTVSLSAADQQALTSLAIAHVRSERTDPVVATALEVAEKRLLSMELGARVAASTVLPSGFDARLDNAAAQLTEVRLNALVDHLDGRIDHQAVRIERLRCALRLQRWLATARPAVTAIGSALQHYLAEGGWVDRALEEIGLGDPRPSVQQLLDRIRREAISRRDAVDVQASERLAATMTAPLGTLVPVEHALANVVAPIATADYRRVLLVVLDGMSVATAVGLAEQLSGPGGRWREIVREGRAGQRTPVLAALPSETTYSRTSLLTGTLRTGTAADERAAFSGLACWNGRPAELFHKADLVGAAGNDLGPGINAALGVGEDGRDTSVVAVVLNTVDDSLGSGVQGNRAHLGVDQIAGFRALLERAWSADRVVALISDHGHVLDRQELTRLRSVAGAKARWRPASTGPVVADEVLLEGPRVLVDGHRAVFAATPGLRYGAHARGYHGGVALGEITIPLLAFVRVGSDSPAGWETAGPAQPAWWGPEQSAIPGMQAATAATIPNGAEVRPLPAPIRPRPDPDLFEGAGHRSPQRTPSKTSRGNGVVRSAAYRSAGAAVPVTARLSDEGVARLLDRVLEAGGVLPIAEAMTATGLGARNPRGVFAVLRRLLNLDGFEVLTVSEVEGLVSINRDLLDEQFPGGAA